MALPHLPMTESGSASGAPAAALTLESAESGVATIELTTSRGSSIPLGLGLLRDLERKLRELEDDAARDQVNLLLIRTAPPHPVLSGYDLEELRALSTGGIVGWSHEAQSILRRLEQLPFPSVAVVQGDWSGGAAELALACSYRVAAATHDARVAFPQARRGLVPAWGGTVRLPRLVGLNGALRLILTGDPIEARDAREIGLVDKLIPVDEFEKRLQKHLTQLVARGNGELRRKRRVGRRLFEDTAPGRRLLAARAGRRHLVDPSATLAARLALELMVETCALPLAQAFDRESAAVGELIVADETQGRLYSERVAELVTRSTPSLRHDSGAAAVLGGGETGSEFARLLIAGGAPVRIKDTREVARSAAARTRARIAWEVRQDQLTEAEGANSSAMVDGVSRFGGFGILDVAIAVPDGTPNGAAALAAEVEPHIREDCLLGYHDWSLSPRVVQAATAYPGRVVGLVPALPVDRFPLLEIVPGPDTTNESVGAARRLVRKAGATPVVVREPVPTPGVRLLSVYLAEATRILEVGVPADRIDSAMEDFGFGLGPFRRIDAIGSRRVGRMLDAAAAGMGERVVPGDVFRKIAGEGASFYRYRAGRPVGLNADLAEPPKAHDELSANLALATRRRILLLLINEAFRIVEDGSVDDPADLEAIAILGLGFPREHGGLLYYAQTAGLTAILSDLQRNERVIAPYFAAAPRLVELVAAGRGYLPGRASSSGHGPTAMLE